MIKFLTFGAPKSAYYSSVMELCRQARNLNVFGEIRGLSDFELKNDPYFWKKHRQFIEDNSRGYGYWVWKPYIIMKSLGAMNEDDILIYMDSGCTINAYGKPRLQEYIDIIKKSEYGILSFHMKHLPEKNYTKKKLFEFLQTNSEDKELGQCMATVILMKKNDHSTKIINEWYRLASLPYLINDECENEATCFISHRHDQSIYSLLVKKYGSVKIDDETFFAPNWKEGWSFPFWATRLKR